MPGVCKDPTRPHAFHLVRRRKTLWWGALAVLWVVASQGLELRLDEDQIFLSAEQDGLRDILGAFTRVGVAVSVEPGIDALVTGTLEGVTISEGLDELLGSFNYLLFWRVVNGPAGRMTVLSGIHLFRPGRQGQVVPLMQPEGGLEVIRFQDFPPHARADVLLGLKSGITAKQFKELLASINGTVVDSISSMGIYLVRLPLGVWVPDRVVDLRRNPWVAVAEPNYVFELPDAIEQKQLSPLFPQMVSTPQEGAAALAIFDSGLQELKVLQGVIAGFFDAVQFEGEISDPVGHGTQMALIASGAVSPDGATPAMVRESVPILVVRSFDEQGQATNYGILRGVDYVINKGGRVVSLSWGTETESEFLRYAIGYMQEKGLIVVAAAGNESTNRPMYPAAYRDVLAITAQTSNGDMWGQSNHAEFIFAAAPGVGSFPVGHNGPPGTYAGTSIASSFVARALTHYFLLHPDATNEEAVAALKNSLTDSGERGHDDWYGYGALDEEALKRYLK